MTTHFPKGYEIEREGDVLLPSTEEYNETLAFDYDRPIVPEQAGYHEIEHRIYYRRRAPPPERMTATRSGPTWPSLEES